MFCLAAAIGVAGRAPAAPEPASYRWRNVAIKGGGFVTGLTFHPQVRDLLYARTDVGGAFRWDAAGERWIALNDAIGHDHSEWLSVISLALDPADPQAVFLACGAYAREWGKGAAFLRSTDRGRTWRVVPLPFKLGGNDDGRSTGERLQVDPNHGAVLLLGTSQDGLWRSQDRGDTWSRVRGFPGLAVTWVCFVAPVEGESTSEVYAGTADSRGAALYRSADSGATWAPVAGQPRGLIPHRGAVDRDGTLYVTYGNGPGPNDVTDGAVWKFEPLAGRWTEISPARPNAATGDRFGYAGLVLDPTRAGTLLVSTLDRWKVGDDVFRSTDGGRSWQPLLRGATWDARDTPYLATLKPHWITSVAVDPFDGRHAWFVTGYGVWRTTSADAPEHGKAARWIFASDGLEETVIDDLVSPATGPSLLSAMGDLGGFRHDDLERSPAGGTFRPMHGGNPSIAVAARQPTIVARTMAGGARGALSRDGGATWTEFAATPEAARQRGAGAIAVSADGESLLWLPKHSGPFHSQDGGRTWKPSRIGLVSLNEFFVDRPVADPVNAAKFYVYEQKTGRVYVSNDRGVTFKRTATLVPRGGPLRAEPGVEGRLWLPVKDGLLVSLDGGRTFARCAGVTAARQVGFGRAAPGKERPAVFLLGAIGGVDALYRSDDSGQSWVRINDPATQFGWVRVVTGDPRVYGRVYLGTSGRGIILGEP